MIIAFSEELIFGSCNNFIFSISFIFSSLVASGDIPRIDAMLENSLATFLSESFCFNAFKISSLFLLVRFPFNLRISSSIRAFSTVLMFGSFNISSFDNSFLFSSSVAFAESPRIVATVENLLTSSISSSLSPKRLRIASFSLLSMFPFSHKISSTIRDFSMASISGF